LPADIDWNAIADPRSTTVLYMPRATLGEFVDEAVTSGLDPHTPAVAIASATLPEQAQVTGPVIQIEARVCALPRFAPLTIIIGWVARDLARASAAVRESRVLEEPPFSSLEPALP
jgi:uroporphyrin-III C-methyltransferase/precorrin-2 dehydrogenase/sirohydrochlorin ferrochelatase